ncbi:glycosyltransferase [Arthrobacter humicola]
MKILHVVNDANTGGAQTLIETLASHASPLDEVHILVLMDKGALSTRLENVASSVSYAAVSRTSKNLLRPVRKIQNLVRSLEIDVVHSHLLQSDLVCLFAGLKVPVLSTLHTSGAHESNVLSKAVSRVVALLSRRFTTVVACSPSAKTYAERMNYANSSLIEVIHNGSRIPQSLEARSQPSAFLSLSRWHVMKDHRTLLIAFKIFAEARPDWRLICAGNGVDNQNLELAQMLEAEGLQSSVELLGPVSDVASLLKQAAALVISSSHGEALPMAGIEALAHGVPVITTDVGDCNTLSVGPDLLVNPRSPSELAGAMETVASLSHRDYTDIQVKSRKTAEDSFNSANAARAYMSVYKELLLGAH